MKTQRRIPHAARQSGGVVIEAALSIGLLLSIFSGVLTVSTTMMRHQAFIQAVEPLILEYARNDGLLTAEEYRSRVANELIARGLITSEMAAGEGLSITPSLSEYQSSGDTSDCTRSYPCMVKVTIQARLSRGLWRHAFGDPVVSLSLPAIYKELT